MAAIEQSTKTDEDLKSSTLNDSQLSGVAQQISNVFPKYDGDQFSTGGFYLDGMLYLSRMADSSIKTKKLKNALTDAEMKKQIDTEMVDAEQKNKKENAETDASDKLANKDVVKNSAEEDMNAKLTCALSLCNWSRNPANAVSLFSTLIIDVAYTYFCCTNRVALPTRAQCARSYSFPWNHLHEFSFSVLLHSDICRSSLSWRCL